MIEIKNINKSFGDKHIIKGIDFTFERGKTNLIIGESGCGKTTLLKLMVGLHNLDSGEVLFDGQNFPTLNSKEQQDIRTRIGMLFQGGALFDSLTLEENVQFPLDMFTTLSKAEKLDRVNYCLEMVMLEGKNKLNPAELSGGMKKRAALARAIANSPKYLFCDEPNSGLDPKTAIVIDDLIKGITEKMDITTIVITHDMNSVMGIGENVMFIHKGEKWWSGTKNDVLKTDNQQLVDFVFASEFIKKIYKEK